MKDSQRSNRDYIVGTMAVFIVLGTIWHLLMRPVQQKIRQEQRDGVFLQGSELTPMEQTMASTHILRRQVGKLAEQGQWKAVEGMLGQGVGLEDNLDGRTLLMIAAQHGYLDMIRKLCDRGSKVNTQNGYGNTALHFAARHGQVAATRLLLARGADAQIRNGYGASALDLAVLFQREAVYRAMRDGGVMPNLQQAIAMRDRKVVEALLKKGVDLYTRYDYGPAFSTAIAVSDHGITANSGIIRSEGTKITARLNDTPLNCALDTNQPEMADLLLAHGLQVDHQDRYGSTALMQQAARGNTAGVRYLLRHGAKADLRSSEHKSALNYVMTQTNDPSVSPEDRSTIIGQLQQAQGRR